MSHAIFIFITCYFLAKGVKIYLTTCSLFKLRKLRIILEEGV